MRLAKIDRTGRFDPAAFMWHAWQIAKLGENWRSLRITKLPLAKISLVSEHRDGFTVANQLERLRKSERIPLDGSMLEMFWKNKDIIPEWWKTTRRGKPLMVFFMGTMVVYENGVEAVLCLYWNHGRWYWSYRALRDEWTENCDAAVVDA